MKNLVYNLILVFVTDRKKLRTGTPFSFLIFIKSILMVIMIFFYSGQLRQKYSMCMEIIYSISLGFPKKTSRYGQELLTIRSENPRFKFNVHNYEFVWVQNNIIFEETLPIPVIKCIIDYKIDPLF